MIWTGVIKGGFCINAHSVRKDIPHMHIFLISQFSYLSFLSFFFLLLPASHRSNRNCMMKNLASKNMCCNFLMPPTDPSVGFALEMCTLVDYND